MNTYNLPAQPTLINFFCSSGPTLTDNDDTYLICPDGTLITIKKKAYNRDDQKLYIKGSAAVDTTIAIINADTDEILIEKIRVRGGSWLAEIKDVGDTLENITVVMSSGVQLTRRSKIVKMPMMIMTINVTRITGANRVSGVRC